MIKKKPLLHSDMINHQAKINIVFLTSMINDKWLKLITAGSLCALFSVLIRHCLSDCL